MMTKLLTQLKLFLLPKLCLAGTGMLLTCMKAMIVNEGKNSQLARTLEDPGT